MHPDDIQDLLADYCLGLLAEAERQSVEAHLEAGCLICGSLLDEVREVTSHLLFLADEQPPDSRVKKNILSKIATFIGHSD